MEDADQVKRRSLRRGRLAVVGLIVAAGLAGTAAAVVQDDGGDEAELPAIDEPTGLDEPTGFDEPYTFEWTIHAEEPQPDSSDLILVGPIDTTTTGEVADAQHWQLRTGQDLPGIPDSFATDVRRIGDTVYRHGADQAAEQLDVDAPDWFAHDARSGRAGMDIYVANLKGMENPSPMPPSPLADATSIDPGVEEDFFNDSIGAYLLPLGYVLPVEDNPVHIARIVDAATDLTEEDLGDGVRRMRGLLPPIPEMAAASTFPLEPVPLALTLDAQDRPLAASFELTREDVTVRVEAHFSDWGSRVSIEPPPDEDIDHTPWIGEELLEREPGLLVAPSQLPDGWGLVDARVLGWSSDLACASVDLTYEEEDHYERMLAAPLGRVAELDHLYIAITTKDCADELQLHASDIGGEDPPHDRYIEVGDLSVAVQTSIDDDEAIDELIDSFRRVSVNQLVDAAPDWVRARWEQTER